MVSLQKTLIHYQDPQVLMSHLYMLFLTKVSVAIDLHFMKHRKTTVPAKNLLYRSAEIKSHLNLGCLSKLTANFNFWLNFPFKVSIKPKLTVCNS